MKAGDVMQRGVITVTPETAIEDAVHLMVAHHVSGLPVIDGSGAPVGILSQGDLLRRVELGTQKRVPGWLRWIAASGREARNYVRSHARWVGEVMSVPVISVTPDTDLVEVVALMEARRIKRIPVIEDGRITGIIARADLIRSLEKLLPRRDRRPVADAELRRRVLASLKGQPWTRGISIDVRVEGGIVELVGLVTDEREREGIRVLAENTPGAQAVIDHLLWIEPMSGIPVDPPTSVSQ